MQTGGVIAEFSFLKLCKGIMFRPTEGELNEFQKSERRRFRIDRRAFPVDAGLVARTDSIHHHHDSNPFRAADPNHADNREEDQVEAPPSESNEGKGNDDHHHDPGAV
jgi:hypothetical protein